MKKKFSITFSIFIISILAVCFLYFYKDILIKFGLQDLYFLGNITIKTIGCFVVYFLSFLIMLSLLTGNIKNKQNLIFLIVAILLFVGIGIGGILVGINTMIIYYLVSCYSEEILKFSIGQNVLEKNKGNLLTGDLIFFAILAGLGFSVIENLFYLIVISFGDESSLVSIVTGRSILTTVLHITATGLIAFLVVKKNKKGLKYRLKCLIGIICGFGLHALFNLSLAYNYKIITILIFVVCYFILSFLFFNSDLVYSRKSKA